MNAAMIAAMNCLWGACASQGRSFWLQSKITYSGSVALVMVSPGVCNW
jgi:hypothetical protein